MIGPVSLGGNVVDLAAASAYTCALLDTGAVRCWGRNFFGELGLGHTSNIGDNELPSASPPLSLGNTPVVDVACGYSHCCVLYDDGTTRCWGDNQGQLGYANLDRIGDNEVPSSLPPVDVGGVIDELSLGHNFTCVRIGTGVKCWGQGNTGVLGYADTQNRGDDEVPSSYGLIDLGFDATRMNNDSTGYHVCALSGTDLRCWGDNWNGALGLGHVMRIGDDETPASAGTVSYL